MFQLHSLEPQREHLLIPTGLDMFERLLIVQPKNQVLSTVSHTMFFRLFANTGPYSLNFCGLPLLFCGPQIEFSTPNCGLTSRLGLLAPFLDTRF